MELNVFMVSIQESSGEAQVELLQMMREHLLRTKNVIMGDLSRIFVMIHSLLRDAILKELILETHLLLDTFISLLLTTELNLQLLWPDLITNLADSDAAVRKSTKRIFVAYIKKTRNVELVARILIEMGLRDDNFYVRERCLNLVPDAVAAERNVLFSRSGLNDARRLLEAVIVHLNDTHQSVREQATKVLCALKDMNLENFDAAFKRLSVEHQTQFTKALVTKPDAQQKFLQLNLEALKDDTQFIKSNAMELSMFFNVQQGGLINEDISEWQQVRQIYKQFLTNEIKPDMSVEQMITHYPSDFASKLYFGFMRRDILQDCLNPRDAMVREYGIRQMYETFFDLTEDSWDQMVPDSAYQEESTDYMDMFPVMKSKALDQVNSLGFMPQFFKFITYLLAREDNFKIINVILNVVNKIIQVPGIHVNTYLPLSFSGLVQLLGDERVVIRRRALFLLRKLITHLKKKQYLMNLMFFLDDVASDVTQRRSWHVKEELMNLISILILETQPNEYWFYVQKSTEVDVIRGNLTPSLHPTPPRMNFTKVLVRISYFLDDAVAKVRQAALETLAVLCSGANQQEFLQILFQVLDKRIYDSLTDKIEQGRFYYLNKLGNLEMPVVNIQKLEEQRRAFLLQLEEFKRKADEAKDAQRLQELEQEERERRHVDEPIQNIIIEEPEQHYKITYYENGRRPKYPLSQRDRVEKSNKLLDSLFINENSGIDVTKYDIIVPINDIKVTQYRGAHKEAIDGIQEDPLHSNIYLYKEKVQQQEDDEIMSEPEEVPHKEKVGVMQYMTKPLRYRGHQPETRIEASKVRTNEDIRSRVRHNITQLNEDRNVDLQIPKVIKANVGAYEQYKYNDEGQESDPDEEIFLDNKKLKELYPIKKVDIPQAIQIGSSATLNQVNSTLNQVNSSINYTTTFTSEQKYEKRLQEFILTFENKQGDRTRGRNAKKLKNKLKTQQLNDEPLPLMSHFPTPELSRAVDGASAETTALIVNLCVIDLEVLHSSVSKLRRLLHNHLDVVYTSQIPLTQMITDLCRLLSPSRENPIHKGEFAKYQEPSSMIVRVIVANVLSALSECALSFKRAIDPCIRLMFQSVAVWLKDQVRAVSLQAEECILEILKNCDDTQVSDLLPSLYDLSSFLSKIYVGVVLQNLIVKWQQTIIGLQHFPQMITIISWMVSDNGFDVRRQGKKVYFKLLSLGANFAHLEPLFHNMNFYQAERMRDLITKHQELESDHQIGQKSENRRAKVVDMDNYMKTIAEMSMVESQQFYDFGDYEPTSNQNHEILKY